MVVGEVPSQSSYKTARDNMKILELENRCTGNRTVGSNSTLSIPKLKAFPPILGYVPQLSP